MLDPMTAAFLYARSGNPNGDPKVCDQTVPVFDGEARFNLILKPKRTVKLQKNASTGYSGFAAVCRVKFIPIAGYRPDNPGIKLMSETNEIEVWLVSLPGTEMYVPYRIVLPTLVGYGYATSTSFQNSARRQARKPRLERSSKPARQGLTARAQIPICSSEQMPKINTPLIRLCSVPVVALER